MYEVNQSYYVIMEGLKVLVWFWYLEFVMWKSFFALKIDIWLKIQRKEVKLPRITIEELSVILGIIRNENLYGRYKY